MGRGGGGRQSSPGGREEEARRPPATGRRGGKRVRARGSRQPVSRGRTPTPPPPPPALTSCAFKFRPVPLGLPESLALPKPEKNKTRKRPPPRPEEMVLGPLRAPKGAAHRDPPVTSPRLTRSRSPDPSRRPALSPPYPGPPRPLPRTPAAGARAPPPFPPPRPQARLGLLPLQIAQRPPGPFKVHEGRVSHQTLSGRNLAPHPLADPHFQGSHQDRSLYTLDKAN